MSTSSQRRELQARFLCTVTTPLLNPAVQDLPLYTISNNSISPSTVTAVHSFIYNASVVGTGYRTGKLLRPSSSFGTGHRGIAGNSTFFGFGSSRRGFESHHGTGSGYGLPGTAKGILYGTAASGIVGTGTGSPYHNQTNITLASTGSGYSYANACNQASISWTKKFMTEGYIAPSIYTPSSATAAPPASDVYTLCDGIPRMRPNFTTQAREFVSLQQVIAYKQTPTDFPICSIQPTDCASLLLSYSSAHNVPASASLGPIHTEYEPYILDDFPRCQTNTVSCKTRGADCALSGSGIQLFYWPQTWADGYCGDHKEIVTMDPTIPGKPNTATWMNYTFTSPTVYVKYNAISAHDICGNNFGPTLTGGVIALPSEHVSSKVPVSKHAA